MAVNRIFQVSEHPLIITATATSAWERLPVAKGDHGYLLAHPMWHFGWSSLRLYGRLRRMLKQEKNLHLIILHNSESEYRFARFFGFDSRFLNQNIHINEYNFQVQVDVPKKYDAVYVASAKPYKRIHLASAIEKLYVVTYFWPDIRDKQGNWDLHAFEPRIKHADFNRTRISAPQVSQIVNASHCALALSRKEGAMWATMEYLLSGIPIVSTPSLGGRDFFFDERYVTIVPPKPTEIAEAVAAWKEVAPDPHWIRVETLRKIDHHRRKFHALCQELANKHKMEIPDYDNFSLKIWGPAGVEGLRIL